MPREIVKRIADDLIDASINRLSSIDGDFTSYFFLDLREIFRDRQRITQQLIDLTIDVLNSRGLEVRVNGTTLNVTVDLNRCFFSHRQSEAFSIALGYARTVHGRNI